MNKTNHYDTAKAVVALLAVALMAGVFFIFNSNKESILEGNQFSMFMTLAIVGSGFLIGLLFLSSKPEHKHKKITHKSSSKSHKKK